MPIMFFYLNDKLCGRASVDFLEQDKDEIEMPIIITEADGNSSSHSKTFYIFTRGGERKGYLYDKTLDVDEKNKIIFVVPEKKTFWDNIEI